jgi:hypothetical protein
MDQDQLNPYVAYEGYVVRVPHKPQLAVTCEKFSGNMTGKGQGSAQSFRGLKGAKRIATQP